MSNIDKITTNEQLFTELTPEEGAVIEGGVRLYLVSAKAIKAGADFGWSNGDDVYATFSHTSAKTHTTNDVDTGEIVNFYKWLNQLNLYTRITLYDDDTIGKDYLGHFDVKKTDPKGWYKKRISGSGSTYDVKYALL